MAELPRPPTARSEPWRAKAVESFTGRFSSVLQGDGVAPVDGETAFEMSLSNDTENTCSFCVLSYF